MVRETEVAMIRRTVVATLLLAATAQADQGLRVPLGAAEVTLKSAPQAVLSFLESVAAAGAPGPACPVGQCAAGDEACRQNVFHAVVGCLAEGRLTQCAECAAPDASATLFRAHGGGIVLYGAVGARHAVGPGTLRAVSRAVESPPLLFFAPAEGGTP
jgi:hypothetical protein